MDRVQILTQQGLYKAEHSDLLERLQELIDDADVVLISGQSTLPPLLQEKNHRLYVSPLGAISLASGAAIGRTATESMLTLDGGAYLPGPTFTERLGFDPAVPFDLREVEEIGQTEPNASSFVAHYNHVAGRRWDGWSCLAHMGEIQTEWEEIANLMATAPRSMFDPYFKPPGQLRKQLKRYQRHSASEAKFAARPHDWMPRRARRLMHLLKGE